MAEYFPRRSIAWRLEQPHALRRLSLSVTQMAIVTGVVMRLWRSFVLTHGSADSWAWIGGTFLAGVSFLFLMCAIHLANFTLRQWLWRAPLFAVIESVTEIAMSLALTTVNLEPLGAERAALSDWIPTGVRILSVRLAGVILFSMVLAVVVSLLRRMILTAEDRAGTVAAVHRASADSTDPTDNPKAGADA